MCTCSIFISSIHDCFSYCFSKSLYISGWILFYSIYESFIFPGHFSFNFFHDGFEKFKFCCMEDVKFKLCNKIHPSLLLRLEILFCYVLQKTFLPHKITKFVFIFSFTHFMTPFFALLMRMSSSLTALCLMIGTSRISVNISCYSVLCAVCSEIVIHGM